MSERPNLKILLACGRPLVLKEREPVPMNVIRPGEEIEAVRRGLKGIGRGIRIAVHGAATLPEVNRELLNAEPEFDVLHFIGHGQEVGALDFEDDSGGVRAVTPDELARLVRGRVKLLVTMACFSENVVKPLFSGGEPAVPAAVCIDGEYPIEARAAELFSGALYSGLAQGRTLKQSFDDAVDVVRIDDIVGERTMPTTDDVPTPWRRFILKGDGGLTFSHVPAGSPQIEEIIQHSPHAKIARTDELFVGRNTEIAALVELLEPPRAGVRERKPRIVTLCGEGGIGKTRLAQAAADWLARRGRFPGGIFEVACDGISDARRLALAVLKAMGAAGAERSPEPADTLTELLKGQGERTLLALDNLDDLFAPEVDSGEAGRLLKECLTASSALNILATCRWPLNLGSDEHWFTVDPMRPVEAAELFVLCIPDRDIQAELRGMSAERQMALFGGILTLTAQMPLCVILAARRLTRHGESPETLLKKAADDLVKTMEDPSLKHLPERLRSLRASLDLSYNRLSEPAQEVFARMSFFPGGLFRGMEDMWELLGDNWAEAAEELARYALARYDRPADRYTMLLPVMEYAREKLDAGEGDDFRRKAAEYWSEFAWWHGMIMDVRPAVEEQVAQRLSLPDDPEVRRMVRSQSFATLTAEEDNVVHAAVWSLRAGDEVGLGMVDALIDYLDLSTGWYTQDRLYRLALPLRRQLAESDPQEYMPDVARTLGNMGKLQQEMGHPDEALEHYKEALVTYRELSSSHPDAYMPNVAMTLNNMGVLLDDMGHPDEALEHYKEALETYRELSSSHPDAYMPDVAGTLNNMGNLQANMGHPDEALEHYKEALDIRRAFFQRYPSAYARDLVQTLRNAMQLYEKLGMADEAAECMQEMAAVIKTASTWPK